jgi:DNA-binding NtrC family response regulator
MVAESGEQALELSRCFAGTIHALVSDVRMPKVDGFALREQIVVERPGIKVLLMSGQATIPHGVPFLRKPFKAETLTESVRRLFVQSTAA